MDEDAEEERVDDGADGLVEGELDDGVADGERALRRGSPAGVRLLGAGAGRRRGMRREGGLEIVLPGGEERSRHEAPCERGRHATHQRKLGGVLMMLNKRNWNTGIQSMDSSV